MRRGVITVSHGGKVNLRITSVPVAARNREMIELYMPHRNLLKER